MGFVEFACDAQQAQTFGALLQSLGFSRAGRHIHKDVMLYRQGDIWIVVNWEKTGLAHSAHVTRGLSAYAMGLKVNNAEATVTRAQALGAELLSQPVGPDEMAIAAIRGMGGGVLYFLDDVSELASVWKREFVPFEPETSITSLRP